MAKKTIFKSFSILACITIFEKIIAFVFEAIIAAKLGANITTDAYFTASEFFTLIDSAFLSSLTVIAINRFSHHQNQESTESAFFALSNILSFYLPLMIIISGAIFLFADPLSYIVAPGYDDEARLILIRCIKFLSVIPVIVCVTSVELAILRQKKQFGITGLKSLFISVVGIISLLLFGRGDAKNADALVFAYIVSILLYCILTSVCIRKYGKLRLVRPSFNDEIKQTIRMVLPLMVSYGIARVALMVGKIIASLLGEGYVSSLTYAHSLYKVVAAIFITNLTTILLTDFNNLVYQKKFESVNRKIRSVVPTMTVLLIPITVVSVVCSRDIVKIVYERGYFTSSTTEVVASVLVVYALNFIPAMIHGIYNQILYAVGDTKTPMWIALASIVTNLSVSFMLIYVIGLSGVAVGTLVASLVAVALCHFSVKKYLPKFKGCYSMRFIASCIASTIVCIVFALLIKVLHLPAFFAFAVTTAVCGAVFLITLLLLKEKIVIDAIKTVSKMLKID